MAGVLMQRLMEVLQREAESLSKAAPLLAKIQFTEKSTNNTPLLANYTTSGDWEIVDGSEDDLYSRRVEQVHFFIPGPIRTNCWETAFYLAGLTDAEGGTTPPQPLAEFIQDQVNAGKLTISSLNNADLVVYRNQEVYGSVIHASVQVDLEIVREHLKILTHLKILCAQTLNFPWTPKPLANFAGRVLIERFGACMSDGISVLYANGEPLNNAIDLGTHREHPTFYAIA